MAAAVPPRKRPHPVDTYISQNLRTIRLRRGLTQKQLAELAGISRCTVNRCENKHTSPSLRDLVLLAQVLQVSLDDLVKPPTVFQDLLSTR